MTADVFLYGRTKTYDYFDMYIPEWLGKDTEEYREYRKVVSFIMKIRDILPENRVKILENTKNSFFFIYGHRISMLCRFCHICSEDEFGRPISSTEGFVVKNSDVQSFRKVLPDAIAMMSGADRTFYDKYNEKHGSESKPQSEASDTDIVPGKYVFADSKQFKALKKALDGTKRTFSFVYGSEEKSLYDYSSSSDDIRINIFFASDECTEVPEDPPEEENSADFGSLVSYAGITKTSEGRLKYRVVICRPDSVPGTGNIAYESYEREAGSEIKLEEIFNMHQSVCDYLSHNGVDEKSKRKAVPYGSETCAEFTGKKLKLEYVPPQNQRRSFMQIIKGEKLPDFTEYIVLHSEDGDRKLSDITPVIKLSDDSSSRLVSYEALMEVTG
jgi:hypothetical protein